MLAEQRIMAFVAVTDGEAARRFYEGVLGLKVLSDDDFALVLQARNATLRIQKIAELKPQQFTVLASRSTTSRRWSTSWSRAA